MECAAGSMGWRDRSCPLPAAAGGSIVTACLMVPRPEPSPLLKCRRGCSVLMDDLTRVNRVHAVVTYVTFWVRVVILGPYYNK